MREVTVPLEEGPFARDSRGKRRLFELRILRILAPFAIFALIVAAPFITQDMYFSHLVALTSIYALVASSMWLFSLIGEINFALVAFVAIGAYVSAVPVLRSQLPFWMVLPLGAGAALAAGLILGLITLRVRGVYFFMVAFAFVMLVQIAAGGVWQDALGGKNGISRIPAPEAIVLPGNLQLSFSALRGPDYAALTVTITFLSLILMHWVRLRLRNSTRAIAQNLELAEAVGISAYQHKVLLFSLSAFFSGLAGVLLAHLNMVITPADFGLDRMIFILTAFLIGGPEHLIGSILGVSALVAFSTFVSGSLQPVIYGLGLMVAIVLRPQGFYPQLKKWFRL